MAHRNPNIAKLKRDYLFEEIARRKKKLLMENPKAKLINLGIGDTTEPIPELIVDAFIEKAKKLATDAGYSGYGDAFGDPTLREGIAKKLYQSLISPDDIFISDGAKSDLGRLQLLFGNRCHLAIQDPSYPVYVGTGIMTGKTVTYMPSHPDNDFFPDLETLPQADLIFICSPNNPTGKALTHQQLQKLVTFAKKCGSIILFDAAYAGFIKDPNLPRSIYEIEGAKEVAIEIGSFSKLAGFTGVRLGWTAIPSELCFKDGSSVQKDWIQIITTFFNGASNLAESGGIALLSDEGLSESKKICDYYMENAQILRETFVSMGYSCYGGENAPYVWVDINKKSSWDLFDHLLHQCHVAVTPGAGFGPSGEGFIRLSAFGKREHILEASARLQSTLLIAQKNLVK